MEPLKINADGFNLTSTWTVTTGSNGTLYISNGPNPGSRTVTFSYDVPDDVTVTSAKVHSIWGAKNGPVGGYATGYPKVNGIKATADNDWMVDITIDPNATSVNVTFEMNVVGDTSRQGVRECSVDVSDIYLLIEYESNYTPPELVNYTDPNPVVRETYVKAVHMTELHTNVNRILVAYGHTECSFTSIISGETGLGGWNDHVREIRNAIDSIGVAHETWIELGDNYPRLDVLMQLRSVIAIIAAG